MVFLSKASEFSHETQETHLTCFVREIKWIPKKKRKKTKANTSTWKWRTRFVFVVKLLLPLFSFLSALFFFFFFSDCFLENARGSPFWKIASPISPSFVAQTKHKSLSLSLLKNRTTPRCTLKWRWVPSLRRYAFERFVLFFFERRREENWMRDFYNRCSRHSLTFFLFLSRAFIFMNKTDLRRVLAAQISPTRVRSILIRRGES